MSTKLFAARHSRLEEYNSNRFIRCEKNILATELGGEITAVWDLIESIVQRIIAERALTDAVAKTPIFVVAATEYPRLRGATALVAAPRVA